MVARAGFEPAPTGLKNRHPGPLGERAENWFPIKDSNLDILTQNQTSWL